MDLIIAAHTGDAVPWPARQAGGATPLASSRDLPQGWYRTSSCSTRRLTTT